MTIYFINSILKIEIQFFEYLFFVKVISALRKTEKQDYSKSAIYDVYYVK